MDEGVVKKRVNTKVRNNSIRVDDTNEIPKDDDDELSAKYTKKLSKFTLMEELLLLSLKEDNGEIFLFNDSVSFALRACFLIELAVLGRIELEPLGARRRNSQRRNLIVVNKATTGEPLLDEALRLISEFSHIDTVSGWLDLLSGETWNPFKMSFQMREVRTRICKGLAEKGVCTTSQQNYILFNLTVHPISDSGAKMSLINYFNDLLIKQWTDPFSYDPRDFSLLALSYATCIAENALSTLDDKDYNIAYDRIKIIGDLDPEKELLKASETVVDGVSHRSKIMQVVFACLASINNI